MPLPALAAAAAPQAGKFALRWLLPIIMSMLGRKVAESSEGPVGQIGGTLLEFGGLGALGSGVRRVARRKLSKIVPRKVLKQSPAARRVVRGAAGAAGFAPFLVPQALALAEQPLVPEGLGDLESALASLGGAAVGDEQTGPASPDLQLLAELLGGIDDPRNPNVDLLNLLLGGRDLVS